MGEHITVSEIAQEQAKLPAVRGPFESKVRQVIGRDNAYQERTGGIRSQLSEGAERACAAIQRDCRAKVDKVVAPALARVDETERHLLAEANAASQRAAELHAAAAAFQHAANDFRRAAGRPTRPILADVDGLMRASDFERRARQLDPVQVRSPLARVPVSQPDFADLVAS